MKAIALAATQAAVRPGLVLCHNVFDPAQPRAVLFRKGHRLRESDAGQLRILGDTELHLIELGPEDVGEDEAGQRLAVTVSGAGTRVGGSAESQVRIHAAARGLLRVDPERLAKVNIQEGVTVWTLEDRTPVEQDQHIASAKVAPLAVHRSVVEAAEAAARGAAVQVLPYLPCRLSVLVTEQLAGGARARFEAGLYRKSAWFDAPPPIVRYVGGADQSIVEAFQAAVLDEAQMVLVGGTASTDPLDRAVTALYSAGGEVLRRGVPAHPGSTYWLGALHGVPVLGLASCGMFSKLTALDLLLPRFYAGESVTVEALLSLAVGGLIGRDRTHLFPRYDADR
ncbi:MAG: hypothetical protein M3281_10550 [Chloroflexota bacterium]|nr:hypothetical protein [Chloroflexota bacterium]